MKEKSRTFRLGLFLLIAAVVLSADLGTKHYIFKELGRPGAQPTRWVVKDVFGYQTSFNQGALFGIGQGQIPLFATLSGVALFGIAMWVWTDVAKSASLASILGLIAGGIVGNLWDRLGMHGLTWTSFDADMWSCSPEQVGQPLYAVRDWILVMLGNYPWPNFNIADSCLVCGAILIGGYALLVPQPKPKDMAAKIEAQKQADAGSETDANSGSTVQTERESAD